MKKLLLLVLLATSVTSHAAMFVNSGDANDYVYCGSDKPFGNCPDNQRFVEIDVVRSDLIKFRFIDKRNNLTFNWFYASKNPDATYSVVGAKEENTSLLTFTENHVSILNYDSTDPDNKSKQSRETFLLVQE